MIPHLYRRPDWTCADDGAPWPCEPARVRILDELGTDRVALQMYCADLYVQAIEDLPAGTTTGLLFGRFLGWTR